MESEMRMRKAHEKANRQRYEIIEETEKTSNYPEYCDEHGKSNE